MPATIHSLAPVTLAIDGGSDITLPVESMGFGADILGSAIHHSGNLSPTLVAVPGANPRVTLTVPWEIAYETFGLNVVKLTALSCYLSKFADFVRAGAGVHSAVEIDTDKFAAAQIVGWGVNVDGIVMANIDIAALSDTGMDHPLKLNGGKTLPVLTGTPKLHTLGPVKINNVVIPGLVGVDASMNAPLIVQRSDGDLYPRVAARPQNAPSMRLSHADPVKVLTELGLLGSTIGANTTVYFKEYDPNTGVANDSAGTATSFTFLGGRLHPSGVDSRQGQVSTNGIDVLPTSTNGILLPFAVALNATSPSEP